MLLLILVGVAAAACVWKLGGVEQTKVHLKSIMEQVKGKLGGGVGAGGGAYSQVGATGLPR